MSRHRQPIAYDLKLQLCDVLCHLRPKQFNTDTGEIVSTVASTHGMFDNADPNRGGLPQAGKTSKVAHLDIVNPQTNALVGVSDDASAAAAALGYTILGGAINLMGIREGSFTGTTEATADANLGAEDMLTNKALRMMLAQSLSGQNENDFVIIPAQFVLPNAAGVIQLNATVCTRIHP